MCFNCCEVNSNLSLNLHWLHAAVLYYNENGKRPVDMYKSGEILYKLEPRAKIIKFKTTFGIINNYDYIFCVLNLLSTIM